MKSPRPTRNPWPSAIIACFFLFILGLAAFILLATGQRVDLVHPDYYEEELRYQQHLDRMARTHPLDAEVAVTYDQARQKVLIRLPAQHAPRLTSGHIQFYRPADAALDQRIALVVDTQGLQELDAGNLKSGLWKVRLFWKVMHEEFFFDQEIVLGATSPVAP